MLLRFGRRDCPDGISEIGWIIKWGAAKMGKQIIGIDLEKIAEYRERVEVGVSKDRTVLLPLIKLKDAHIAEIFLSRLDAIRTEWAIAIASYKNKAGMYANLKLKVEGEEEASGTAPEMSADEYYEAFKQVTVAVEESQKHQASLIKRVRAITEEIHEFLAPYLEGLGVIEVLKEADDAMTQKVLYAMLYGTAAFTEEGELANKEADSPEDVKKN